MTIETPRSPIPDSDEFRTHPRSVLLYLLPAVILLLAALGLPGNVSLGTRAVGVVISLLLLRVVLLRLLFRVRMNPDGMFITGTPGFPWIAITGCRLLRLAGGSGFEIEYRDRDGKECRARVPGSLSRYLDAWRMFLAMTDRHDAPWSPTGNLRETLTNLRPAP